MTRKYWKGIDELKETPQFIESRDQEFPTQVPVEEFLSDVSFVALKNGQHNGVGYFVDSDRSLNGMNRQFPLSDVFDLIVESFQDAR